MKSTRKVLRLTYHHPIEMVAHENRREIAQATLFRWTLYGAYAEAVVEVVTKDGDVFRPFGDVPSTIEAENLEDIARVFGGTVRLGEIPNTELAPGKEDDRYGFVITLPDNTYLYARVDGELLDDEGLDWAGITVTEEDVSEVRDASDKKAIDDALIDAMKGFGK